LRQKEIQYCEGSEHQAYYEGMEKYYLIQEQHEFYNQKEGGVA
jgi:hypothetical protein